MSQVTQTEKEKKRKKRGVYISSFFHIAIIALSLYPFMSMTVEKEKGITIAFEPAYVEKFKPPPPPPKPKPITQEQSAASEAPPEAPDMPEAQTAPAPEPEPTPPDPVPEPTPAPQPEPVPEPKPAPAPKPTPKPVVTQPQPTTPPAPKETKPQATKSNEPVDKPTKPKQTEGTGKSDKPAENPKSPTNPSKGTSSSSNETGGNPPRPGKGTDGKSPDPASGLGDGEEEQGGIGDMSGRRMIKRANLESIVKKNGRIEIYICIDRYGRVMTSKASIARSTIKDKDILQAAANEAKKMRFSPDAKAPKKECRYIPFTIEGAD